MPIPIADENPTRREHRSVITISIIFINVLIFFVYQIDFSNFFGNMLDAPVSDESILGFGLIPGILLGDEFLSPKFYIIPSGLTLITHMFLHGGLMHLVSNMLILWVFGDNIEQEFGRYSYLGFYLGGGVVAGLTHAVVLSTDIGPLIGASGAISAVAAAYLLLHPKAKLWILLFFVLPVKIPAWSAIGAWIVYQFWAAAQEGGEAIAWWAHIGGFAFGIGFVIIFKRHLISPVFTNLFSKTAD